MNKLDTTNSAQLALLHRLFSHNMAAVDFYLKWGCRPAAQLSCLLCLSLGRPHLRAGGRHRMLSAVAAALSL